MFRGTIYEWYHQKDKINIVKVLRLVNANINLGSGYVEFR